MKKIIIPLAIFSLGILPAHADFVITSQNGSSNVVGKQLEFVSDETGSWSVRNNNTPVEEIESITFRATFPNVVADSFAGGSGVVEDPFLIETPSQLRRLAYVVNEYNAGNLNADNIDYSKAYYKLTTDIDMSGLTDWEPIGSSPSTTDLQMPENDIFSGNFDGDGHCIKGFTLTHKSTTPNTAYGLFGILGSASISNLKIEADISFSCSADKGESIALGAIAGVAHGATISNCSFSGQCLAKYENEPGAALVGGIVGSLNLGTIQNCSATIYEHKSLKAYGDNPQVGAIVGYGSAGDITDCEAIIEGELIADVRTTHTGADIIQGTSAIVGGIAGASFGADITNCTASISGGLTATSVTGNEGLGETAFAGGIVGTYGADALAACSVYISGKIYAEANSAADVAGCVALQTGGYGISGVDVTISNSGYLVVRTPENSTSYGSSSAASVAGICGRWTSPQGGGGITDSHLSNNGKLEAKHPNAIYAGGIIGAGVPLSRCSVINNGNIEIASGKNPSIVGGICGNITSGTIAACYFINNGDINISSENGPANFGGIAGSAGTRLRSATVTGCYTIFNTGGTVSSSAMATAAGISGNGGNINCSYWYCQDPEFIKGHVGGTESTDYQLADTEQSTLEAAAETMNAEISDYGKFEYSSETKHLEIKKNSEE